MLTYLIWELSAFSSLSKARVEPHLATWARPLEAIPPYSQTLQKNIGFRHSFKFNILIGNYLFPGLGFLKLIKFNLDCYDIWAWEGSFCCILLHFYIQFLTMPDPDLFPIIQVIRLRADPLKAIPASLSVSDPAKSIPTRLAKPCQHKTTIE